MLAQTSTSPHLADAIAAFVDLDRFRTPISPEDLGSVLSTYEGLDRLLREHRHFDPRGYCRNSLHHGPAYEALLLCWLPGQLSPIHDHSGSACAFRVLEGVAVETTFVEHGPYVRPTGMTAHVKGAVSASFDRDIHEVANGSEEPLVTLHLYSPPLAGYRTYERLPAAPGIDVS